MNHEQKLKAKAPALAAALSLLGASLGIMVAGDAVADANTHAPIARSAQLRSSQANAPQTKGKPVTAGWDVKKNSQTKGRPVTNWDVKSSSAKGSQKGNPVQRGWDIPRNTTQ